MLESQNKSIHNNGKTIVTFLLFFLVSIFQVNAQCISVGNSVLVGGNLTATATVGAQAYYWTVSGPATISGSNTGSSVSILATGTGFATVTLSYFQGGQCFSCQANFVILPCPYTINESISMCWGASANCYERRGSYSLSGCNGFANADWEVTPNAGGNCINYGCTLPGTNRFYGSVFKPNPVCNWVGQSVTVKAYQPGTNNLWASYNTIIQDCDSELVFEDLKNANGNQQGGHAGTEDSELNLKLIESGVVKVSAVNLMSGEKVVLHEAHGQKGEVFDFAIQSKFLNSGQLYSIVIEQNGVILKSKKIRLE